MENYILSIGIATKDREQYCIAAIQSILDYKFDNIQIVIADNGNTTLISDYVKELGLPFIKYVHEKEPLSFVENFNRIIEHCQGKYVTIIGDDDSVLSNIVPLVHWMDKNQVDALTSSRYLSYFWPNGVNSSYKDALLNIPVSKNTTKVIDVTTNINRFIKGGFIDYLSYDLPKIYHGIIRKEKLDEYKQITGVYFGGLTPDIYSAVALAFVISKNVIYDKPFSIAGVCPTSGSHQAMSNKHIGSNIYEAPHFRNRGAYQWDNGIPPFYSVTTIWAETAIKAIRDMKKDQLLASFNIQNLYAHLLWETRHHDISLLEDCEKAIAISKENLNIKANEQQVEPNVTHKAENKSANIKAMILKLIRKVYPNFRKGVRTYENVQDIQQAIQIIQHDKSLSLDVLPQ
jgi:glycosyltransferase involved in cell wall biosynthesis